MSTQPTTIELSNLEAESGGGFVINSVSTNDLSGYSVSAAGDVNGDGLDDVIIGAYIFDLIQDFKNKQDKIFIGSMKKLKLKNKGNNVFICEGKDLIAKVKGAKGELSKKGKYLV